MLHRGNERVPPARHPAKTARIARASRMSAAPSVRTLSWNIMVNQLPIPGLVPPSSVAPKSPLKSPLRWSRPASSDYGQDQWQGRDRRCDGETRDRYPFHNGFAAFRQALGVRGCEIDDKADDRAGLMIALQNADAA